LALPRRTSARFAIEFSGTPLHPRFRNFVSTLEPELRAFALRHSFVKTLATAI